MKHLWVEYGPRGTLWVAPDGEVWRYQNTNTSHARRGEEILWDQPFYTHYFEVWAYSSNSNQNRVNQRGVFRMPDGCVKVWPP